MILGQMILRTFNTRNTIEIMGTIKKSIKYIVNLYNTNVYFHSLATTVEYASIGFFSTYKTGVPTTKSAWTALFVGLSGTIIGSMRGWVKNSITISNPATSTGSVIQWNPNYHK
jgi:hypothetical protein